jgi:hypothetical protein
MVRLNLSVNARINDNVQRASPSSRLKKKGGPAGRRKPLAADLWDGSVNPQPSSSDTSKSNEQPYEA